MQSVPSAQRPEPFRCPRTVLCPGGVQGNSHYMVHEQKEKVAVHRGGAAGNVKFRHLFCRHRVSCLFIVGNLVGTVLAPQPANHLMKAPVIMAEQGALRSCLRNGCQNAYIANLCVKKYIPASIFCLLLHQHRQLAEPGIHIFSQHPSRITGTVVQNTP